MGVLPHGAFQRCVRRYRGDHRTRTFTCHDLFLTLAFAQLTFRESLRDVEICLRALDAKLYHAGIRGAVSRSTLADALESRDWRIQRDFMLVLIGQARALYAGEPLAVELKESVYALDSTTIDLCLILFPWAPFRRNKGAIKLHTLMDLRGSIPTFIHVSSGLVHDVNALDLLTPEPGAFYIIDRGYIDYARLFLFKQAGAFFVTRAKDNARFRRRRSHPVDKTTGLRSDQTVMLHGAVSRRGYPEALRRVSHIDLESGARYVFLTNNFALPALTIARLYKARWQIELFFRWIKQHLRVKAFFGRSENAVKTQIYAAVSTYLLVAIVKKRWGLDQNLHTLLQVLSLTLFEKIPVKEAVSNESCKNPDSPADGQLSLF